jgi:hypothetical protein
VTAIHAHLPGRVPRDSRAGRERQRDRGEDGKHAAKIAPGLKRNGKGPDSAAARGGASGRFPSERASLALYLPGMAPRARILAFGSASLLVLAGALCAALVGGLTGEVLAIALVSLGLGGAVLLVFLEVGLSEDRERAREEQRGPRPTGRRADVPRRPPIHTQR